MLLSCSATKVSFWPHLRENHYTDDGGSSGDHHHIFWAHMENIRPLSAWILSHHVGYTARLSEQGGRGARGTPDSKILVYLFSTMAGQAGQIMPTTLLLATPLSVFQTFLRPCYMYVVWAAAPLRPTGSVCLSVCLYKSWHFFEVLRNKICSLFPLFFLCVSKKR